MPDYDPKSIPILDDVIEAGILEEADAEDKHRAPIADITDMEDELPVDDGTINLFSTAPVELSPEDAIIEDEIADVSHIDDLNAEDPGPAIGTIDSLDDSPGDSSSDVLDVTGAVDTEAEDYSSSYPTEADIDDSETEDVEEEPFESALIDYHDDADTVEETKHQVASGSAQAEGVQHFQTEAVVDSVTEQPLTPIESEATPSTIALDDIIDEVVNDIVSQLVPDLQQQLKHLVQQALEDRLPAEIISQDKADSDQGST